MNTTIINSEFELISQHPFADVMLHTITQQKCLKASIDLKKGAVVSRFFAKNTQTFPTYLTVQTGIEEHITLMPEFLQYVNHSCNPNVFFDTTLMQLVCLKDIAAGEELTFFYPSTEWEMSQPFVCNCQTKDCLQLINGAAHLTKATLKKYRLSDFIKKQIKQQ